VGDGIGRTVGPVELREGVQLNFAAEDITVEGQGFTSGAREVEVRRRAGHASDPMHFERDALTAADIRSTSTTVSTSSVWRQIVG